MAHSSEGQPRKEWVENTHPGLSKMPLESLKESGKYQGYGDIREWGLSSQGMGLGGGEKGRAEFKEHGGINV